MANLKLPDWFEDPLYQKSQDLSFGMGKDILSGNLPEWMQGLGKTGSPEFQNMLNLVNTKTAQAVAESNVRRNISRSGVGASSIAKATADATTTLSWQDYLKAAGEKQNLLTTGLNTMTGVRAGALDFTGQKNQFGMQGAELSLKADMFNEQQAEAKKQQKNAMWGQILSSAIGAVGTIGGMMVGGPIGAAVGGSLGSAVGKSVSGKPSGSGMDFTSSILGNIKY
jgi:hypothetical protein